MNVDLHTQHDSTAGGHGEFTHVIADTRIDWLPDESSVVRVMSRSSSSYILLLLHSRSEFLRLISPGKPWTLDTIVFQAGSFQTDVKSPIASNDI